jgi:hypothetical protein
MPYKRLTKTWVLVAHPCNPSYAGGCWKIVVLVKMLMTPSQQKKLVHICHSSYSEKLKIGRLQSRLEWAKKKKKKRPYLWINQDKNYWTFKSNGRAPASQEWSPEFKPQYHQKLNSNKKRKCLLI